MKNFSCAARKRVNLALVRAGVDAGCCRQNESQRIQSLRRSGGIPATDSGFVVYFNLFHPERRFFATAPNLGTQPIPVRVAAQQAVKSQKGTGARMLRKAHPPSTTGQRDQARRKALETAEHAAALLTFENSHHDQSDTFPFSKKKRSLRFNGCAYEEKMQAPKLQKIILVEFKKRFKDKWTENRAEQELRLRELQRLAEVVIPYKTQLSAEHRRATFERRKLKLKPLDGKFCFVCANWAQCRHHIIAIRNGGINSKKNIIPLCHSCHAKIHPWL